MFQKQPAIRKLLYSLLPIFIYAFFFYGLRFLANSIICVTAAIACEYVFKKQIKKEYSVSESIILVSIIYILSLPPALPVWIAAIGIIFGIVFCNIMPGRFFKNPINQSIISWLSIYIVFYNKMTTSLIAPSFFGIKEIDGISSATPLAMMRDGILPDISQLFYGLRAGAAGEGAVILIIFAAIYLFYTKAANWKVAASAIASFVLFTGFLFYADFINAFPPVLGVLSGSILFGLLFMTKDPLAEHKTFFYPWIYGIFIGIIIALIRTFSPFTEGTNFAILFVNIIILLTEKKAVKIKSKNK